MRAKSILALDFDGLLVDGLNECLLVSWNGHHGESVARFSDAGLAAIPDEFIAKFEHHRSFAKHLGHFFMPFQAAFGTFGSQQQFDEAYASLDPCQIEMFVARVSCYRAQARTAHRDRWLAYHQFYPGLDQMLRSSRLPVCIVTAKDSGSVQEILVNAGIHIPDNQIYGECREKLSALQVVAEWFQVEREDVCFFDDNVQNARDALQAGYRAHWALWGYHAPEHFDIARQAGLPAVDLDDLISFEAEVAA